MNWPVDSQAPASPFDQFHEWYEKALASGCHEPAAMSISTVGAEGRPSSRMVLLKHHDEDGFRFATHYGSRKAEEIRLGGHACLLFYWGPLHRQIRIEGKIEPAPKSESDAIFARRPRGSQLGAWASPQSQPLEGRQALLASAERLSIRFPSEVPRPPHWGAYLLRPGYFEFWEGQRDRLHRRLTYRRESGSWAIGLLAP